MSSKKLIWLGLSLGMFIGGSVPTLWGASTFSFSSVLFSGIGGAFGIWAGYRLSEGE